MEHTDALKRAGLTEEEYTRLRDSPRPAWFRQMSDYHAAQLRSWEIKSESDKIERLEYRLARLKLHGDVYKTKILATEKEIQALAGDKAKTSVRRLRHRDVSRARARSCATIYTESINRKWKFTKN